MCDETTLFLSLTFYRVKHAVIVYNELINLYLYLNNTIISNAIRDLLQMKKYMFSCIDTETIKSHFIRNILYVVFDSSLFSQHTFMLLFG